MRSLITVGFRRNLLGVIPFDTQLRSEFREGATGTGFSLSPIHFTVRKVLTFSVIAF